MCSKVQMYKISHICTCENVCKSWDVRNFAHPHTLTCAKHVQRAWCGCWSFFCKILLWKCVRKCGCAKFRTSAHPHAFKMCAICMKWLPEFFFAKKFLEMSAKVRMCKISHVRTPARVQNVCNVHGVAAGVFFFCKKIFGNVCESADVRNFARPHTRTLAKCVQCAWCGCQSFFLQKFFWICV